MEIIIFDIAESYFSRLRRAEIGIHHKIAGPYVAAYAGEMDWREDTAASATASNGWHSRRVQWTLHDPVKIRRDVGWRRKQKMTKNEQKAAEKEAYVQRVQAALKAAHEACRAAGIACIESLPKDGQGLPRNGCGDAWVHVYAPSYQFRTTLQELRALERGHAGAWIISEFTRSLGTQSYQANKAGAKAACEVLRAHFPEETDIQSHVYET